MSLLRLRSFYRARLKPATPRRVGMLRIKEVGWLPAEVVGFPQTLPRGDPAPPRLAGPLRKRAAYHEKAATIGVKKEDTMKVKELMSTNPVTCSPSDNLSTAAMKMWDGDCGVLPVVDNGRVRGVITDRDIAMALTFKGAKPSAIDVAEVIGGHEVYSCSPDEEVVEALKTMRDCQVRRLPVVEDGRLRGLLSMNDVALAAHEMCGKEDWPTYSEVLNALQSICAHRPLATAA
jgi:CBS domain-containing protein